MATSSLSYEFVVVGHIQSCFKQKFGIPRQPGLVKSTTAKLILLPKYSHPDIVRGLVDYSHIWISFVFHESITKKTKNTVRPPRLGGNDRQGVFATRSNFRPNPLGQSLVKLESVDISGKQIVLQLSGIDILDGTPVIDIKPYLAYADSIENDSDLRSVDKPEKKLSVIFSSQALSQIDEIPIVKAKECITELLSYDPRPAYVAGSVRHEQKNYACRMWDVDIHWVVKQGVAHVIEIRKY